MDDLLQAYYKERIAVVETLIRDAPDDVSRRVFIHLKAGYERDLAQLSRSSKNAPPD